MEKKSLVKNVRTWIELDKKAIEHNYKSIRGLLSPKTKLMAVVKSNAYGHGLIDFSTEMGKLGLDWFGVDSIVEAIALRKAGITKPILVLGYTLPDMLVQAVEFHVSVTVSTFELLAAISKSNFEEKLKIHVKVDTGMHRQGFDFSDHEKVLAELRKLKDKVEVEGLFTHFAAAKNPAFPARTENQLTHFANWQAAFKKEGYKPIEHVAASGGAILYKQSHFDMVRVGIAMYGIWPSGEVKAHAGGAGSTLSLEPVLSWKTIIGEIKKVKKGERVGYDFTEELKRDSLLVVCPIGYWHGFPRALSGIGEVLIGGKRARVVGRVSMDMIVVDATETMGAKVGDEVVIIGKSGNEEIFAENLSSLSDTSAYEIVTRTNPLIKKIIL
jgi:alanine racemase